MSRILRTVMIAVTTATLLVSMGVVAALVPETSARAEPEVSMTAEATDLGEAPTPSVEIPPLDFSEPMEDSTPRVSLEQQAAFERAYRERRAKQRALKRFAWEAPTETRARLWNIPENEHDEATATAFLRVCFSEADGYESDCLGIWKVFENTRSRSCSRNITKITECDENGETMLSIMKRHSGAVLGVYPPRTKRSTWIANLELDCEQPRGWYLTDREWHRMYTHRCRARAKLARQLVAKNYRDIEWPIENVRIITWGGRCESGRGACDDDHACRRGLARVFSDTKNAFWCRPKSSGCADDIDEVCIKRGFPSLHASREETEVEEAPGG